MLPMASARPDPAGHDALRRRGDGYHLKQFGRGDGDVLELLLVLHEARPRGAKELLVPCEELGQRSAEVNC